MKQMGDHWNSVYNSNFMILTRKPNIQRNASDDESMTTFATLIRNVIMMEKWRKKKKGDQFLQEV